MAKIFMLSNTQFGYKNHLGINRFLSENEKFFNDEFIPFLKKYSKAGDYVVHFGNVFKSGQSINIRVLNTVLKIFESISDIVPVYFLISQNDRYGSDITTNVLKYIKNVSIINTSLTIDNVKLSSIVEDLNQNTDILLTSCNPSTFNVINKNVKIYTNHDVDTNTYTCIKSPYPINKDDSGNGFVILDTIKGVDKFIPNKVNDKYKKLTINSINDLCEVEPKYFEENFVELVVGEELYNNVQFKIKLSELNILDVEVKQPIENCITDNIIVNNIFNIDELILHEIENNVDILNEFKIIKKIHDDKVDE